MPESNIQIMEHPAEYKLALFGENAQRFPDFMSASELRTRGWTASLIEQFLPDPCRLETNPHNVAFGRMRLFSVEKIREIESYDEFRDAQQEARKKSVRRLQYNNDKAILLMDISNRIEVKIPSYDLPYLLAVSFEAYQKNQIEFRLMDDPVAAGCLLAVEYLEQHCEPALWQLDEYFHVPGIREARNALQRRIYKYITVQYPELGEECQRRIALLESD